MGIFGGSDSAPKLLIPSSLMESENLHHEQPLVTMQQGLLEHILGSPFCPSLACSSQENDAVGRTKSLFPFNKMKSSVLKK